MKRVFWIALIAVIAAGGLAIWFAYPIYKWNQKLTVTVETPEGVKSGASVVAASVSYNLTFGLPDAASASFGWHGEATIVELPGKRFLFVLLGNPVAMAQHSFKAAILGSDDARLGDMKAYFPKLSKLHASAPLVRERYPLLVTFDDINDPKSVKKVDPNNLAATFGPGYSLKSVTLEITDEPVTTGELEKLLGWLGEHPEPKLGPATGGTTSIPFYRRVSHGDFIRR